MDQPLICPKKLNKVITKGKKQSIQSSLSKDLQESDNKTVNLHLNSDKQQELNSKVLNEIESTNEEMVKIYENIQKDKEAKLKEYRNMVLKLKKEKRVNNLLSEEQDKSEKDPPLEDGIVKTRLEMRKSLAESLKNKK